MEHKEVEIDQLFSIARNNQYYRMSLYQNKERMELHLYTSFAPDCQTYFAYVPDCLRKVIIMYGEREVEYRLEDIRNLLGVRR